MQKTPLYKRCLPALALILALMLPLVSLAEVSKVVKGGALNMRAEPSLSAQVLRQYPTGTWMTVLEDMGEWSKVRVNGLEGYVMSKYLSDTSSDSTLYVRTNTGRGLNLRDLPSLEGNIITSFKPGTAVTVLLRGNGWYKVSVQGMTGYMASQYLSASQSSGGGTSTSGYPKTGVVNNPGANQVLLLRETASTDARVLGYYRNGTSVQLLGESGSFYKVTGERLHDEEIHQGDHFFLRQRQLYAARDALHRQAGESQWQLHRQLPHGSWPELADHQGVSRRHGDHRSAGGRRVVQG